MDSIVKSNIKILARELQVLREAIQKPISINSGYRCDEHNKAIGGVKYSKHLLGMAADIRVDGMNPKEVAEVVEQLIDDNKIINGGLGIYPSFVHFDIYQPTKKRRWNY
jgi:uncharacterized protein YcbK (DUF882 family)